MSPTALSEAIDRRFHVAADLEGLRKENLFRDRSALESPQGPRIRIDGRDCLNFCSNDYLSLAAHPRVVEALRAGAARYGAGSGASAHPHVKYSVSTPMGIADVLVTPYSDAIVRQSCSDTMMQWSNACATRRSNARSFRASWRRYVRAIGLVV